MTKLLFILVVCHLIGDYCLQSDFIAKTKGQNWYHLFVHCALYVVPFYVVFGWCWQLGIIFVSHMIVDPLKSRYYKISYCLDQIIHYVVLSVFLIWR